MRIVFAGTPAFAATCLQALLEQSQPEQQLVGVYTQPDRPAGRGRKLMPSAVKTLAQTWGLPVFQPPSFKQPENLEQLRALQPDLMVVVAYGLLLPQAVLNIPRFGCVNVHASLLPAWRGAAPIQRALLAGDTQTGVTLMQMDAGLDTGAMLYRLACPIEATDTSASLHDKLARLGGQALVTCLPQIQAGQLSGEPQDAGLASYAHKLTKEEARLDWQLPAQQLDRQVRGYNPWPVAWFHWQDAVIRVWQAQPVQYVHQQRPGTLLEVGKQGLLVACGEGALLLQMLQLPGSKALPVEALLNGRVGYFRPGQLFAQGVPNQ